MVLPWASLASRVLSKEAEKTLGWKKSFSSLEDIVRSAYDWRLEHPGGYSK